MSGEMTTVSLKDYAGTDKKVSVYAVDYAGNRSDTVKFDNPYYKEPAPTEKPAAPTQASQSSTPATKPAQTGRPLIERIRKEHPEYKILQTFFSPSILWSLQRFQMHNPPHNGRR